MKNKLLIMLVAILLTSCSIKKSYNKVASDIPATPANKNKLVGWVAAHFPINEKVVIKDSITEKIIISTVYDTTTVEHNNIVYKYINKVDTLYTIKIRTKEIIVKDTLGNYMKALEFTRLNDSLNAYKFNKIVLTDLYSKTITQRDAAERKAIKRLWLLLLLLGGFALFLYKKIL